jgi:hypothetical protein
VAAVTPPPEEAIAPRKKWKRMESVRRGLISITDELGEWGGGERRATVEVIAFVRTRASRGKRKVSRILGFKIY